METPTRSNRWRRLIRVWKTRGGAGTVRHTLAYLGEQYEMWRWDRAYGVETRARVGLDGLEARTSTLRHSRPYQGSSNKIFHQMLARLDVDFQRFTFIDLGSGKGKALLLASDYPLRKIIGVELCSKLTELAGENCRRYSSPSQKCREFELVCSDAAAYALPNEPVLLYFFNPFDETVMERVAGSIRRSLEMHPRELYILYRNPQFAGVFERQSWARLLHRESDYVIFRADV